MNPWTPTARPDQRTIVGKNEIYHWKNLVAPFLVHIFLGPFPPLLILPCPPSSTRTCTCSYFFCAFSLFVCSWLKGHLRGVPAPVCFQEIWPIQLFMAPLFGLRMWRVPQGRMRPL